MDKDVNFNTLFKDNGDGKLVLPNFQRDFEWNVDDQKRLLSSVLAMLPIGSLLILEGEVNDFATRQLCFTGEATNQKNECLYLLDGQQRISTLKSILSDLMYDPSTWELKYDNLYKGLRYRWFLNVKRSDSEDVFGYRTLQFKSVLRFEPGQLLDYIECRKITKQNKKEWYHPSFCKDEKGKKLEGHRLKNEIAKKACEFGLIPLYDVYNSINLSQKSLLEYLLEKLASDRVSKLMADVADNQCSLVELLTPVCPEIEEILGGDDLDKEQQITFAWSNLAATWKKDMLDYLRSLLKKDVHIIQLPSNEIGRATAIYESINKGGLSLSTYDLIVAKAARVRSEKSLTQRIIKILTETILLPEALKNHIVNSVPECWASDTMQTVVDNKLATTIREQYLNLLSIFSFTQYGDFTELKVEHIKKEKILSLGFEEINKHTEDTINALVRACAFLQFRCGKIYIDDLNYRLMILPIAYVLKSDSVWTSKSKLGKLEYWYWASMFAGSYRESQNQRCMEDIVKLYNWINGNSNPFEQRYNKILNAEGYSDFKVLVYEDTENDIPKAISDTVLEYVLSTQPQDFLPDREIILNAWDIAQKKEIEFNPGNLRQIKVEDHHVFPLGAATSIGESSREIRKDKKHLLNSPLNRTLISDYANRLIKDKSPEKYFEYIADVAQWGHCLGTDWSIHVGESDKQYFQRILQARYNNLKQQIKTELSNLKMLRD